MCSAAQRSAACMNRINKRPVVPAACPTLVHLQHQSFGSCLHLPKHPQKSIAFAEPGVC